MTPEAAFEKLIQTMLKKIPVSVTIGTVDSVDKEKGTCDVLRVYIIIEKGSSFYLKSIPFRKDFQRT